MIAYRMIGGAFVFVSAVVLPWWAVIPLALIYAAFFRAYELVVLAALIDGFFGAGITLPYYTIGAFLILLLAEWVKPSLSFLND